MSRFRHIVEIAYADIDIGIFPDGYDVRQTLDAITMKARGALMYLRQRRGQGELMAEEP